MNGALKMTPNKQNLDSAKSPEIGLKELERIYFDGNPLALHEALGYCSKNKLPPPDWITKEFRALFIGYYLKNNVGERGQGNSLLGRYKKVIKRHVLSEAYHTVRAWQKNPYNYVHMPRRLVRLWFDGEVEWGKQGWEVGLRFAQEGLKGTEFQAQPSTIKKAKYFRLPRTVTFGHFDAEVELGLRGENGIFGAPSSELPEHIQILLRQHRPPRHS